MGLRHFATSVAICVLPAVLVSCGESTPVDPRTEIPLVRTAIVEQSTLTSRAFTGTVAARVQSDLGFRVSGKVLERFVDTGQTVKRGQLLMRIDPVDLKLAAVAQEEVVAAAQALALQTAKNEARSSQLRGTGAISEAAYDLAKAAADTASAQLKAAKAQLDVARNASRYSELFADGDGVVMATLAEPGQVVGAGQTVVRLAHAGSREAVIQLPETLRPAIGSVGQANSFGKPSANLPATLRQLSDAADQLTRTFEARYVLEGELANAPLGTTITIQLADESASVQDNFQVPIGSLFDGGKGPGVWVITGEPAKVSWRRVEVQHLDDHSASLTGELTQGEQIVTLGAHLLRDGERVRVAGYTASSVTEGTPHE